MQSGMREFRSGNTTSTSGSNTVGQLQGQQQYTVPLTGRLEHNYPKEEAPGVDAYFRGLGVDPEDSRTNALGSAGDKPIKSCWDRLLTRPEFEAWRKAEDTSVLWVVGGPGKGKTVMSLGLVDELAHAPQPSTDKIFVGFFFCRDMESTTNTAISILKGLIYGLGQRDRSLMYHLSDKFKSPDDLKGAGIGIDTLWSILAGMLNSSADLETVYFVVDALDECRDDAGVRDFVSFARKASFRRCVKWVFTSRQSPQLRRSLDSGMGLHMIDLDVLKEVEESVDEYLDLVVGANQQFSALQKQEILDILRLSAEKTFLYVRLVLEDLRMAPDIARRISELKNNVHGEGVYRQYRLMLRHIIEEDEKNGNTILQDLLKAVLIATETLSLPELAIATGLPPEYYNPDLESGSYRRMTELVQQCGHILTVAEGKVYLVHKSAKDYLTLGDGGDEVSFFCSSSPTGHALVAERCLRTLENALLPTPDLSTFSSVVDAGPSQESLERMNGLQYIYCHWAHHAAEAQGEFTNWQLVERLLETKFLTWVEVMGYLDRMERCVNMVQELLTAIGSGTRPPAGLQRSKALLEDGFQFLVRYRPIIQMHPRQAYLLAKYFTPKISVTRKTHEHIKCCIRVANNPPVDWDPCQYTLDVSGYQWGDKDQRKATAPRYKSSRLLLAKVFWSYTSRDFRLAFSADSKTVSVGSGALGRNVLRWNVADGSFAGSFDAAEDGIAQSNDGRLIASWSEEGIGVWDAEEKKLVCRLENTPSGYRCTAFRFADDYSIVAVVFEQPTVFRRAEQRLMVWNARDGPFLYDVNAAGKNLIRDIRFLRNSHTLVILFDKTLLLHDVKEHKAREVPLGGISEPSGAVLLSDDGGMLVLITQSLVTFYSVDPLDELARWSVPQDNQGLHAYFQQEQNGVSSKQNLGVEMAVSRDARTAALSFRDSIAFFDLSKRPLCPTFHSTTKFRTPIVNDNFFQSKLPIIDALMFSPCGSYLACARNDDIITIWNVRASCRASPRSAGPPTISEPSEKKGSFRDQWANIIIYSPDGRVCGTKSRDQVSLWDVATASLKLQFNGTPSFGFEIMHNRTFQCPPWASFAWAFSPDSRFAITAVSNRLHIVNTHDWAYTETALPGCVVAMAFNSQSTHFALATLTSPPQVLLIDAASGRCDLCYEAHCESIHAMAFSSSGTLMVGGATSSKFIYYIWEKSDYSNPSLSGAPRCHKTPRQKSWYLGNTLAQIMRIEFSRDSATAVSIICAFGNGYLGPEVAGYADMIATGGPATSSSRSQLMRSMSSDWTHYMEVEVRGRDDYKVLRQSLEHFNNRDLVVSSRFLGGEEGITAGGIDIRPPTRDNKSTCWGVEIGQHGGFSWVLRDGKRVLCFPHKILWVRRDLYRGWLMIGHEPGSVSFVTFIF